MKYDTAGGTSWKGYPFKTLAEAKVSCEAIGTRLATMVELEDALKSQCERNQRKQ